MVNLIFSYRSFFYLFILNLIFIILIWIIKFLSYFIYPGGIKWKFLLFFSIFLNILFPHIYYFKFKWLFCLDIRMKTFFLRLIYFVFIILKRYLISHYLWKIFKLLLVLYIRLMKRFKIILSYIIYIFFFDNFDEIFFIFWILKKWFLKGITVIWRFY